MTPAQLWLARVERGIPPKVFPVSSDLVQMPRAQWNKNRAKIMDRKPQAWVFNADKASTTANLCQPGAAAIDYTPAAAIAAAMRVLAQHEAAKVSR